MTLRLPRDLWGVYRQPPQFRFGTVTSVSPGICTVKVAGGEIPVIYFKNAAPSVGDFVSVQRQSVVSYLMTAPSGALWVADIDLKGLWRIPVSGQDAVFYAASYPLQMRACAEGPDKNMWAVGSYGGTGAIYRFLVGGQNSYLQLVQAGLNTSPVAVCAGPDGNLWVADSYGYVWVVTTQLSVAAIYPLPGSSPTAICAGPDSNIWVADGNGGAWRVTVAGSAQHFAFPAPSNPISICTGPDGNLWVLDSYEAVWRVATSGTATYFLLCNPAASLAAIAAGPDGRLWVANAGLGPYEQIATLAAPLSANQTINSFETTPLSEAIPSGQGYAVQIGAGWNEDTPGSPAGDPAGSTVVNLAISGTLANSHSVGQPIGLIALGTPGADIYFAVTTDGVVSDLTLSSPLISTPDANGVCVGPDGNVWMTNGYQTGPGVWKVDTSSASTFYPLPSNATPTFICSGP